MAGVQVKNLKIQKQSGSDRTYFASWSAPTMPTTTTSNDGQFKPGDIVKVKQGAIWYNGSTPSGHVFAWRWIVHEVHYNKVLRDRIVLNKSPDDKDAAIMSSIEPKYLTRVADLDTPQPEETKEKTSYKVVWQYSTGDNVWFKGTTDNTEELVSSWNPPNNATTIKVSVTPVPGKDANWTGAAVTKEFSLLNIVLPVPNLTVKIEKYKLTASVTGIDDSRIDKIEFQIYRENSSSAIYSGVGKGVTVLNTRATFIYDNLTPGHKYLVRCRAVSTFAGKSYSAWSDYVEAGTTVPLPVKNVKCAADSKTSVKVTWSASSTAKSYTVQYTTEKRYFDASNVSSSSVEGTTAIITGLETGRTWYFRVRATNEQGDSAWSDIVSISIGKRPEPPTTWSLSNTVSIGQDVILYWTHNSEDGSKQSAAIVHLEINGNFEEITVSSNVPEDEDEPIYSYTFDTSTSIGGYDAADGDKLLWMIKTKGIDVDGDKNENNDYSDWSTQRTIDVVAPPSLKLIPELDADNVLRSLPLKFATVAEPATQKPISYHVSVVATNSYPTVDNVGNDVFVGEGSIVYSNVVVSEDSEMNFSISAGDITLESGYNYRLDVSVSMDSGLTAAASVPFDVEWETKDYISDAAIEVDSGTLSATIAPVCFGEDETIIEGVTMSVYRRESDGSFTEIATGLPNMLGSAVVDPHPSLDYARYRIVSTDEATGAVDYTDLPGIPVKEPSIVIQWDEQWVDFDYDGEDSSVRPQWTGSMVRIPYNVDVNETYNPDVSLVEYIGRKNPVSYYGTQRGEGGSWSATIPKSDKETIYALRRLKAWMGDVYVREPSGIGYWARIKVSMSQKHLDATIPVSFEVTRVEGGK